MRNWFHDQSFLIIKNFISGRAKPVGPILLNGMEAKQMKEDLEDQDFVDAVRDKLRHEITTHEIGGVLHVTCTRAELVEMALAA